MCSNNDEGVSLLNRDGDEILRLTESDLCRKCQTEHAEIILRGKDMYCRSCFLVYFTHKFRSTIGKSKEIKAGDRILIGYSGGVSSTALLHLIHRGLNDSTSKKLRFSPHVLFIDESPIQSQSTPVKRIWEEARTLNLPFYSTSIEQVLKEEPVTVISPDSTEDFISGIEPSPVNSDLSDDLTALLGTHLKSQTSREDMIRHLRTQLICRCANQLGFKKVFLGMGGSELSVQILTDIALGRGAQLGDHVQFKGCQYGVELFRPMRELLEDEVRHFIECQAIRVPLERPIVSTQGQKLSINSCTKNFLYGLQKEFVSTIPTVFKTGGKLVSGRCSNGYSTGLHTPASATSLNSSINPTDAEPDLDGLSISTNEKSKEEKMEEVCLFCGLVKEKMDSAVSAAESILVAKALSTDKNTIDGTETSRLAKTNERTLGGPDFIPASAEESADETKDVSSKFNGLTEREAVTYFCYGCANLLREVNNIHNFPTSIRTKLKKIRSNEVLLEAIQDCLL